MDSMHTLANNEVDLSDLPDAHQWPQKDVTRKVTNWFWDADLLLFFLALLSLLLMIVQQVPGWSLIIPIGIMAITYVIGSHFVKKIPHLHMEEFKEALRHREILVMVDVRKSRIQDVHTMVHKLHPEAVVGGVGWSLKALHS